ncbi:hypothetical protein [Flavobacterium psychrophilum]|uniref:hypothetical protein n=1 Tax=Flavobacterium psychrophilum TaxID=96345 RepID=UPI00130D69AE|nr:hypothetical protein [Flavobacterium psychrophilum]
MKKIIMLSVIALMINANCLSQEKSRSAKSGRYVTKEYASKNKSTTYTSKTRKK